MKLKNILVILAALMLCLSFSACTKKAVRPNSVNGPDQSLAETGGFGSSGDVNLITSAQNLVNGIFSAFGNANKSVKGFRVTKAQAVTAMVIGGAVLLGLLVVFQNRPKKYSASKGKYQGRSL